MHFLPEHFGRSENTDTHLYNDLIDQKERRLLFLCIKVLHTNSVLFSNTAAVRYYSRYTREMYSRSPITGGVALS